tara:strand:+ start:31 stop:339 length:309 start_codon:yes stop_codon:yes gene_type:complete
MALFQAQLGTSATTVFNPTEDSAVTTMFICNTHTSAITITIYLINGGGTPDDTNAILKDLSIPAKDTYTMNNERIILAAADFIKGLASVASKVTVTGTFTTI